MGAHGAPPGQNLSLAPQSASSADPHSEIQLTVEETHPHSGPLPLSLCWGCHDNQSSPWMPKAPQKQQQKLHPQLLMKGSNDQALGQGRHRVQRSTLLRSPQERCRVGTEGSRTCPRQSRWGSNGPRDFSFASISTSSPTAYICPSSFSTGSS